MRVYKSRFNGNMEFEENATINRIMKPDRGKILDIFTKIEFLVNHLIIVKIVGFLSEKVLLIDEILLYVELFSRIKILKSLEVLNNSEEDKIMQLKKVRDGFAHKWDAYEINYKNKSLTDHKNFKLFKEDLKYVWNMLIDKYIIEEEKNIEEIINRLSNMTENK